LLIENLYAWFPSYSTNCGFVNTSVEKKLVFIEFNISLAIFIISFDLDSNSSLFAQESISIYEFAF
jgi:hypothetical protein